MRGRDLYAWVAALLLIGLGLGLVHLVIVERITEYIRAGVSKFILRPVGASGEEVLSQTRQLIEQVLPQVTARWPRPAKVGTR